MKCYFAVSMVSALALASLGSHAAARPLPQSQSNTQQQPASQQSALGGGQASQTGSAGGYGGSAAASQDNDYSQVAPGNSVVNGGGQSASLQGLAGSVMQGAGSLFQQQRRRQADDGQQASAGGYAGASAAYQNNDDSGIAPGNSVQLGGAQSASNQGVSGSVAQLRQRNLPSDPTQLLDLFENGLPPTEMLARDEGDTNGMYIASTKFGPVSSEHYPTACAQGGEQHCVPHYLGLGPEVRPSPQVG